MWSSKSSAILPMLLFAFSSLFAAESHQTDIDSSLTVAEFEQLHTKLMKMSTERVWSIPWQLSVRKARELAAERNRPVFLWISSNGGTHPLGPC